VTSFTLTLYLKFLQEVTDLYNNVRKILKSNDDFIDFRSLKMKVKGGKMFNQEH